MSYVIVNRPLVRIDILDALDYYKKINPDLRSNFFFEFAKLKSLSHSLRLVFRFSIKMLELFY